MNYAISILKAQIKAHSDRIKQLKDTDYELVCDVFFSEAEIEERTDYIKELQTAIKILNNNDTTARI